MAYINDARSSRRGVPSASTCESHRASWLPFLRSRPPVGDFPAPTGPGRLA